MIDLSFRMHLTGVFPYLPQHYFIRWSNLIFIDITLNQCPLRTHIGSHVDISSHFISKAYKVSQIGVNSFCKNTILLKVQKQANQ